MPPFPPPPAHCCPPGSRRPKWLTLSLRQPWSAGGQPRLAVRAEPSGATWLSCPPLDLAPARFPAPTSTDPALKIRLKGAPDLEDLEPGEEAPAVLEWLADEGKIWIMSEALRPYPGGAQPLKKLAAGFDGLPLEEALDRVATLFGATWRIDGGWVLFQRRSDRKPITR